MDSTDPGAPLLHMMKSRLTSPEAQPLNRRSLCLLMKSCLAFQATDPKDKVYGVLGLCTWTIVQAPSNTQKPLLDVDYNKSVAEVYMDMTMHLLLTSQHLGALEFHIPSTPNPHLLPSWVFNFESPSPQMLQANSPSGIWEKNDNASLSGSNRRPKVSGAITPMAQYLTSRLTPQYWLSMAFPLALSGL